MDYYNILKINNNISIEELKKAFKRENFEYYKNNKDNKILIDAYNNILSEINNKNDKNNINLIRHNNCQNTCSDLIQKNDNLNEINGEYNNFLDIITSKNISLKEAYSGYIVPVNIERWKIINNIKYNETETIYINIPKGIDNDEIITINNKGNYNNKEKGNLIVTINISETYNFSRNGLDLYYNKSITLKEALCGFKFSIPYLNDSLIYINNEKGNIIKPFTNKVIKNFGMERENILGNLIIIFEIIYPDYIKKDIAESLEKIFDKIN